MASQANESLVAFFDLGYGEGHMDGYEEGFALGYVTALKDGPDEAKAQALMVDVCDSGECPWEHEGCTEDNEGCPMMTGFDGRKS